jgi:hypothetical protein
MGFVSGREPLNINEMALYQKLGRLNSNELALYQGLGG